jgi:hypothetical protein
LQWAFHKHEKPAIRLTQKTLGDSTRSVSFREAWLGTAAQPETVEHVFLVRPDDTVAWRGDALPEDIPALLSTVSGH